MHMRLTISVCFTCQTLGTMFVRECLHILWLLP
jgi:hypothetical protein